MQKITLNTYLKFILLFSICISAQSEHKINEKPRLVVGIVVDQMKYEYIPKFWNKYGDKGFKKLVTQGSMLRTHITVMLLHLQLLDMQQ